MDRRRLVDIVLMKDEILQALRVQSDLAGESIENEVTEASGVAAAKAKANGLRDLVDDDVKRERVIQVISLAVDEAGDILYPYTRSIDRYPTYCFSNDYKEPEIWKLDLDVPVTMSASTVSYLKTLINEYVVGRVMLEYYRIYLPTKLDSQNVVVEDIKDKIRSAKDRRNKPIRRSMSVY